MWHGKSVADQSGHRQASAGKLSDRHSGLHPDGFEAADSGWPRGLQRFAAEAWRRVEAGEITEAELYPGEAQWCGLYDRMHTHEPDEMERRLAFAADYGEAI